MNRYTIELHYIEEDLGYNLFNENFPFYEPTLREQFVKKFYDKYRFREIGAETIYRFKVMLNGRLNLIMPYYTQLYHTELEAKKINFLLNKDLKETFIREITGQNNVESTSTSRTSGENNIENTSTSNTTGENNVESTSTTNTSGVSNSTSEGRFLDTPSSRISDEELDGYLTSAQKDKVNGTTTANGTSVNTSLGRNATNETTRSNSLGKTSSNETSTNTSLGNNNQREVTDLISQGNIGITSSGQLLEDWRKTLINIDMMILNDLNDLFFGLY